MVLKYSKSESLNGTPMTTTESLHITDETGVLIAGETPVVPKEYIIAGYDMNDEFFLVSVGLKDKDVAFLLDAAFRTLSDRLK